MCGGTPAHSGMWTEIHTLVSLGCGLKENYNINANDKTQITCRALLSVYQRALSSSVGRVYHFDST